MSEQDPEVRVCDAAITLAFSVLGKRWNGMILSVLGAGSASFVALRKGVSGISDTVLSDRLVELVESDLVRRIVTEGPPVSVSYELTAAGAELVPTIAQLGLWAKRNLRKPVDHEVHLLAGRRTPLLPHPHGRVDEIFMRACARDRWSWRAP